MPTPKSQAAVLHHFPFGFSLRAFLTPALAHLVLTDFGGKVAPAQFWRTVGNDIE
jgi:hypothetical protein